MKKKRVMRQLHILILGLFLAASTVACQNGSNINSEGVTIVSAESSSRENNNSTTDTKEGSEASGDESDSLADNTDSNVADENKKAENKEVENKETDNDQTDKDISDSSVHLEDNLVAESGDIINDNQPVPETDTNIVYRNNTPIVLTPTCPGTNVIGNELVSVDLSNSGEGYIGVQYKGTNGKVKFQMTGPDGVTYTYDLDNNVDIIPITAGNGGYSIGCYENISGTEYAIAYTGTATLTVNNGFGPYLYPNMYVNFNSASATVAKGSELAAGCSCDLEVVNAVYQYIKDNITYDYELASTVSSGYIPSVDNVLASGKGICFDYAAVMSTMLRSQGIPTRLEVGYAGQAYHAWISTYITDIGWIDGMMQFDGSSWTLMDPTFAANSDKDAFEQFIGNGSNYVTLYKY